MRMAVPSTTARTRNMKPVVPEDICFVRNVINARMLPNMPKKNSMGIKIFSIPSIAVVYFKSPTRALDPWPAVSLRVWLTWSCSKSDMLATVVFSTDVIITLISVEFLIVEWSSCKYKMYNYIAKSYGYLTILGEICLIKGCIYICIYIYMNTTETGIVMYQRKTIDQFHKSGHP